MATILSEVPYKEVEAAIANLDVKPQISAYEGRDNTVWFMAVDDADPMKFLGCALLDHNIRPGVAGTVCCEFVVPSHRHTGLGQAIIDETRKYTEEKGFTHIYSTVALNRVHPKMQPPMDRFNRVITKGATVARVVRDVQAARAARLEAANAGNQ